MQVASLAALLGAMALGTSGCVTFSATPLEPSWTASSQISQQEIAELSVAARALDGDVTEEELVGRPAKEYGFFPLVVMFENQGESAFLLRREGLRLETADGGSFEPADLETVYEGVRWSQGRSALGVPFGILPAFVIGASVSNQNKALRDDLREKTFRDMRLYRNPSSYNCLLFFPMETEKALALDARDCWLTVEVEKQGKNDTAGEVILFRLVPEN